MALADWSRMLAVNLTGPMLVMQAAYPHLQGGRRRHHRQCLLGRRPAPLKHRTAYCASKAGLQMAAKALPMEAAEFGIRVNTVCPGAVETELFRTSIDNARSAGGLRGRAIRPLRAPAHRRARRDRRRDPVADLSGESSYVTGTAIAVDGGRFTLSLRRILSLRIRP
jgi:NAD(P)-dependent dehydrogenase (short-subunit alcohol dehydrogenase family)